MSAWGPIQAVAADEDLPVVAQCGQKPTLRGYDPGTGEKLWSMGLAAEIQGFRHNHSAAGRGFWVDSLMALG